MKDKRRLFAVHFGRGYFKSAPLVSPMSVAVGLGVPCLILLAAILLMTDSTTAAGVVLAATPVIPVVEIKSQMDGLQKDLKEFLEKAKEQQEKTGTITTELKTQIETLQKQVDAIDQKMTARLVSTEPDESVEDYLKKHEGVQKIIRDKSGNCVIEFNFKHVRQIERKTTITSAAVGSATSGILQIDRTPGIVTEARQALTVRDVLSSRPTSLPQIDFVKVNAAMSKASPQTEASAKLENAVTFTVGTANVRTIATWIPATRQVLDDMTELMGFLMNSLPYYVNLEEELQLLSGDNTGQNLNGLITQAQAFDTTLLVAAAGYNRIDCVGRAIQQIQADKELLPTFLVVHPNDYWSMRLTKDSYGRYILGDPMGPAVIQNLFGLTPIPTTNITSGTFLVGSGSPVASEVRDRMGMMVEIATQHSDYFTKNMIAIRAEKRVALVVYRPDSYVTGTFQTSPSS